MGLVSPTARGARLEGNQFQNGSLKVGSGPGPWSSRGKPGDPEPTEGTECSDSWQVQGPALGSLDPPSWGDSRDFRSLDTHGWWAQSQRGSKWTSGQFRFSQLLPLHTHNPTSTPLPWVHPSYGSLVNLAGSHQEKAL